jgi:aspartyl-tRNA(Asn)/glutamyl-tRNA(Gln) amidotransferase subunit B
MKKYIPIIGLEVHVELNTISKMFCQCKSNYFKLEPNTNICPVCLGMPGALPVPNKKAVFYTQVIAKALNCKLNNESRFDRKHYYYPDLPKGYQISQYDQPLGINGRVKINSKTFRIRRVHLEEDTGKLIHKGLKSLIDFNRSGVPLVEIVTEPDFHSSEDIKIFLQALHVLIQQYLKVSDANMEKGTMRLEPNISLSNDINTLPDYRIEIKNINSFRYVKNAVDYEIKRQSALLNKKANLKFETRGYDEKKNITFSQRVKEEAKDYRYFPEPDIPIMLFDNKDFELLKIPELPNAKLNRFIKQYKISRNLAMYLVNLLNKAMLYEKLVKECVLKKDELGKEINQKLANYVINKISTKEKYSKDMLNKVISYLFPIKTDKKILKNAVNKVIKINKKAVYDYKKGVNNAFKFLLGQVVRELKSASDIKEIIKILSDSLKQSK